MLFDIESRIKNQDNFDKIYDARVVFNDDPKALGRIKVIIPNYLTVADVNSSEELDKLPWCYPEHQYSIFGKVQIIPEVNDYVRVKFYNKEPHILFYDCYSINDGNSLAKTDAALFNEDYPKTVGAKDSTGSYIKINKEKKTFEFHHASGVHLKIDKDGNVDFTNIKVAKIVTSDKIILNANILESARETDTTRHFCPVVMAMVDGWITSGDSTVKHGF